MFVTLQKFIIVYYSMRKHFLIIILLSIIAWNTMAQESNIFFIENKNQWPENVLFRSQLYGGYVFLEKNSLTYYFIDSENLQHRHGTYSTTEEDLQKSLDAFIEKNEQPEVVHEDKVPTTFKAHAYKVSFANMNSRTKIYGNNSTPYTENYIKGSDQKKWAINVRSFNDVLYENLYRNIDLHVYGSATSLKYDFVVKPGGNPQKIMLQYSDVPSMSVRQNGALAITTSVNEVYEQKPYAYQIIANDTIEIPCSYHLEHFSVTYDLGAYNQNYALYIDPDLIFSTYSGSTSDNWGFTATYDSENNAYLGGIVEGFGYPASMGAIQTEYAGGAWDIGLIKFDKTGKNRLYATYLGGSSCEMPHSLIANSNNELLILGTTGSSDFPIVNGYQPTFKGGDSILYDNTILFEKGVDMFICRLSADGTTLLSSTFLGGTKNDGINFSWETNLEYGHDSLYYNYGDGARGEIMVDEEDNIYIASTTFSSDFPIVNGFQSTFGGMQDGIVCKFDPALTTLEWSSYIGGDSKDAAYSIDIDKSNNAFVTGGTCSSTLNFPAGGYQPTRIGGTVDAFVIHLDKNMGSLLNGSYFGSTGYDQAHFVRVNSEGNVFLFGQTTAQGNTLISNANYNSPNSGQFLASFTNDLSTLNWSTVFGNGSGKPNISPTAFEVDICNRIYLAGVGREWNDHPQWYKYGSTGLFLYDYGWLSIAGTKGMEVTEDAYQTETDGKDFYIMVIDDKANNLDYATFFGELGDGYVLYNPLTNNYTYYGCAASGRDHVDGGTSRFDANGYIYQSVCASCGGCNGFPVYPNPGVWSTKNNSSNCNSAILRFMIDFGLIRADFEIPEIGCASKELSFENKTEIHYNNPHVTYLWDFGDGETSTEYSPTHIYAEVGNYTVTLWVKDSTSCNQSDSVSKTFDIVTKKQYQDLDVKNICLGDSVQIGIPNEYDETLEYSWSPEDWLSDPSQPNTIATPEDTITYELTVTSGWCQTIYRQTVNTFNSSYAINGIQIANGKLPQICRGETIQLIVETNAPTQRFLWATDRNFWHIVNPDFSVNYVNVSPKENTTYYIKTLSTYCEFEAIDSITIEVFYNKIAAIGDTLICAGDYVPVSVVNDNPDNALSYTWTPQNVVHSGGNTENAIVNPKSTTDIIVFATDAVGCEYTDTVHIEVDELDITMENYKPISCYGERDAQFEVVPIGFAPYKYLWEDNSTNPGRYNLGDGEYRVVITDSLGCINALTINIKEPDSLKIDTVIYTNETCAGACNGTIALTVSGGTQPYSYLWNNSKKTRKLSNLCPGYFMATVTDAHGCEASLNKRIRIVLEEKLPELDAYADSPIIFIGKKTEIHAIKYPNDTISYIWKPNIWLEDNLSATTSVTPDIPLEIDFIVTATDRYGCINTDTVHLLSAEWVCDKPFIFVPTAFTPNNDGKNDVIQVNSGVLTELTFAIFDRWGEKVFETNNTKDTWDGTYNGKLLEPQVFVYYLKGTCLNAETFEEKGNITLIR